MLQVVNCWLNGSTSWYGPPAFIAYDTHSTAGSLPSLVPYPAGLQANDIALLQCWVDDFDGTSGTINPPDGTWTEVAQGTAASTAWKRHAVYWKRLTGSESGTVAVTTSGGGFADGNNDTRAGAMSLWRGCVETGDPFEAVATPTTGQSASPTGASVATLGAHRTVVYFTGCDDDTLSAPANVNWSEEYDITSTVSIDHGLKCYSLEQLSSGTVAAVTHTLAGSERWSTICFALVSVSAATALTFDADGTTFDDTTFTWDAS